MAQVRKYQNAAGPLPKKKWSYKGKEYEVNDEDLKMLNDWNMSNYEFDSVIPEKYDGTPSGKDVLAKKIGLITEDQYNSKYNPTSTETTNPSIVVADKISTPAHSEKKYGRFFRGSASLEGQRAYDALFNANRNAGGWGMTNMALQAVEAGHDVYRGSDGSIVIKDSQGNDITEQFIPKGVNATVGDSQFRRNLGATFNSRNNRYRISGEYLDNIDMTPEAAPDNRVELRRGSGWFTNIKDDKGNDIYDINGIINQNNEETIRNIINFALGNKTDMDAKYKYSAWQDADIAKLREYANEIASHIDENGQNTYADELINAIRSGKPLNEDQKSMLTLIGFNPNGTNPENTDGSSSENPFQLENTNSDELKSYGITGITRNIDENGNEYWTVEGDDKFKNSTWDLQGFGDIFGKFNGGWLYNGRLYGANDHYTNTALGNAVRTYLGNNASNINDWWTAAKQSGVRFYGDENESAPFINFNTTQNYDKSTEGLVWDFLRNHGLDNKNIGIREVTSAYDPSKLNGRRIFAYVDTSDITNRNGHRPLIKYFDNSGNSIDIKSLGEELQFPGTNTTDFIFSNLDNSGTYINNMFTHGTYTNPSNGTQLTVMRDLNGRYYVYRNNPKTGQPERPIAIHPDREAEFFNMIKSNNWPKWRDIEKFDKLKNGGKINWNRLSKLAPGGYISNTRQNVKVDDSKASDITKSHTVDGSNGGLTEAEQLQVMGALADLGGVAASFAPGIAGGIAGGVSGLAGTGLKFVGDIKRDGFDLGDVRRGLVNLAFDVAAVPASLLPGADNAIKASKFVKTIKNIGQPVLKWMGTLGCSAALINTAGKIINGEKYTSDDLIQLAQGLAGGIVAGKQWSKQIGDAKLASKLSGKAVNIANANFSTKTKIGNTGKEIKNDDLETIVKNAKGDADKIKSAIRSKVGLNDDAEIDLESLGITKGRKNLWEFVTRKSAKSTYEKPTKQEGNSFWHYFMNGSERAQALGADRMFWQRKHNNLLGNISEEEYRAAMGGYKPDDIINIEQYSLTRPSRTYDITTNGALRRAAINNPNAFNFEFNGTKNFTLPGQFGARATVRLPKGYTVEKNWKANYDFGQAGPINESGLGDPMAVPYLKPKYTTPEIAVQELPQIKGLRSNIGKQWLASMGYSQPNRLLIAFNKSVANPKGIRVGNSRLNIANYTKGLREYKLNRSYKSPTTVEIDPIQLYLGKRSVLSLPINMTTRQTPLVQYISPRQPIPIRNKNGEVEVITNAGVRKMVKKHEGGLIPMMKDGGSGGFRGKEWKLNLNTPNVLDLAQGISSQIALNKAYQHDENAINNLKNYREQTIRLTAPTLDMNDISNKYNVARNTLKSSIGPNTYTDLALQSANNQAYGQQLVNLDMQEGSEKSNRIMQNNAETNAIINQNISNAINTANRNLDRATQLDYQTEALKSQKIRDEQANIWQPLSQQFRQQFRDITNKKANIQQQIELDDLQQRQLLNDRTGIYKDIYEMYDKSGSSKEFFDWLATNDAAYKEYLKKRNSEEGRKYEANKRKERYDIYSKYLTYSKNGGSIYKHKTIQEEIAVNADKMSKKAVQKMNDNLMRMLQQLLK